MENWVETRLRRALKSRPRNWLYRESNTDSPFGVPSTFSVGFTLHKIFTCTRNICQKKRTSPLTFSFFSWGSPPNSPLSQTGSSGPLEGAQPEVATRSSWKGPCRSSLILYLEELRSKKHRRCQNQSLATPFPHTLPSWEGRPRIPQMSVDSHPNCPWCPQSGVTLWQSHGSSLDQVSFLTPQGSSPWRRHLWNRFRRAPDRVSSLG